MMVVVSQDMERIKFMANSKVFESNFICFGSWLAGTLGAHHFPLLLKTNNK